MKKIDIPIDHSHRIINPGSVVLLTVSYKDSITISTIAWHMPVSKSPKLVALSISNKAYSLELIYNSRSFCINLPEFSMLDIVRFCGKFSGRDIDKFKETGLTKERCKVIPAYYIMECIAHIECNVYNILKAGDHEIVIGQVVSAYTNRSLFSDNVIDLDSIKLIHHLGGSYFGILINQQE